MAKTENNINKKEKEGKEKLGKYNKVEKPSSIGSSYDPDLVNKLSEYSTLTGIKRTELVSKLIAKELEGKVLNNKYISLETPFYFNYKELLEKGTVLCSSSKPVTNIKDTYIIKNVPNNLDKVIKDKNYFTYGFENNPEIHKGIIFSSDDYYEEKPKYLVFELNKNRDTFIYEPELILKISILELNDLITYLDIDKNKDIINNLQSERNWFLQLQSGREKFIKEHKEAHDKKKFKKFEAVSDNLSEKELEKWAEYSYYLFLFMFKNFNYYIPLKLYSDLQNIILLSDKMDKESFKSMMIKVHDTKLTKQDFEQFINTFEIPVGLTTKFLLFFIRDIGESEQDSFNNFINDYLKEEDVVDLHNLPELKLN